MVPFPVPSGPRQQFFRSTYDDKNVLSSRSAARPGDMAPLVTFSSSWGRAPLTPGWLLKWRRTFSWIKLHIQTLCWACRRPCNSPLASMASWYDCIATQTSGMPSLVCEEARITWKEVGVNTRCLGPFTQTGLYLTFKIKMGGGLQLSCDPLWSCHMTSQHATSLTHALWFWHDENSVNKILLSTSCQGESCVWVP